ncbi:MAG: hypothetical protein QM687_12135 [Ferruginibacter sp.]
MTAEQKQQAAIAKIQKEKQEQFETARLERLYDDSVRKENETRDEFVKDSLRQDWKTKKLAQVDSTNNENWKRTVADKDAWYDHERSQNAINKKAGISDIQGRKVKALNEAYNSKAKLIKEDATLTEDAKKTQLAALNAERTAKIKEIVGSNKAKKLDKERKNYAKKNTDDHDSKWIDESAASTKKNK